MAAARGSLVDQSAREERRGDNTRDKRTPAQRDCHRILYSPEFRRLASVTQVVSSSELQLFHNRLTHSLKVAQLGKRIAQLVAADSETFPPEVVSRLGGCCDADVVEAASLAHDLGHPPFGHIAEQEIQAWLLEKGGPADSFEGNAQSFRVITKLSFRRALPKAPALDLTRATLNAVLKYPWRHGFRPETNLGEQSDMKWGAYDCDRDHFDFARRGMRKGSRSLEAEIMDWADDIAYAVHDVEDFFRAAIIPLERLERTRDRSTGQFLKYAVPRLSKKGISREECEQGLRALTRDGLLPLEPYSASREDRERMLVWTDTLISRYVGAFQLSGNEVRIPQAERTQVELLKQMTRCFVVEHPGLSTAQRGQRMAIRSLLEDLDRWASDIGERGRLPAQLQEYLSLIDEEKGYPSESDRRRRAIVDYVASLTEDQALELFDRLEGWVPASSLERWINA